MEALNKSSRDLFRARKVKIRTHLASKSVIEVIPRLTKFCGDARLCRGELLNKSKVLQDYIDYCLY